MEVKQTYLQILFRVLFVAAFISFIILMENMILRQINADHFPHYSFRLCIPFLLLGSSFLLLKTWRWFLIPAGATVLAFVIIIDFIYFSYFETLPTAASNIPFTQALSVWESALALFDPLLLLFIAGLAVLWRAAFYLRKTESNYTQSLTVSLLYRFSGLAIFLVGLCFYVLGLASPVYEKTHHEGRKETVLPTQHWGAAYSNLQKARVFGIFLFHFHDIRSAWFQRVKSVEPNFHEQTKIEEVVKTAHEFNDQNSPVHGIAKGFNVLVIQLESFQYWLLNKTHEDTEVTPFLNKIYKQGFHWNNIYDATYIGRTSDAEFGFHTGMLPHLQQSSAFTFMTRDLFTFPRALLQDNYQTMSFHGYKKDFWNRTNAHPFYGIERMHFIEDYDFKEKLGLGIPDKTLFPAIVDTLAREKDPFYAFVISLSCHHPYNAVPQETADYFPETSKKLKFFAGYLKLARYTDEALEDMYNRLEEKGLLQNTIVVIYGDHDLGVIDGMGPAEYYRELFDGYRNLLGVNPHGAREDRIPITMLLPGKQVEIQPHLEKWTETPGTLIDFFPSIFHLLGKPVPKGVMGSHLFQSRDSLVPLPQFVDRIDRITYSVFMDKEGLNFHAPEQNKRFLFSGEEEIGSVDFEKANRTQKIRTANDLILVHDWQGLFRDGAATGSE